MQIFNQGKQINQMEILMPNLQAKVKKNYNQSSSRLSQRKGNQKPPEKVSEDGFEFASFLYNSIFSYVAMKIFKKINKPL